MFGKLVVETASSTERIDSPRANLAIFYEYPIWGSGLGRVNDLYAQITKGAQTSTITYALAAFGLSGISFILMWIIGIFRIKFLDIFLKILITCLFLIILNKEPHIFFSATYILMFYFVSNKVKRLSIAK